MKLQQLPQGDSLKCPEPFAVLIMKQLLGFVASEALNHTYSMLRNTLYAQSQKLKDFFLAAEVAEGADVGDGEGDAELIFGADLAEGDAAVFEGETAAVSVVGDLHDLF